MSMQATPGPTAAAAEAGVGETGGEEVETEAEAAVTAWAAEGMEAEAEGMEAEAAETASKT